MELNKLNPYVRHVGRVVRPMAYPEFLYAHDHRLLYVNDGGFTVQFAEDSRSLSEGSLFIFPPAVPYRLVFPEDSPVDFYILNFDFDDSAWGTAANAPKAAGHFRREDVFSFHTLPPFEQPFLLENARSLAPLLQEIEAENHLAGPLPTVVISGVMKVLLMKAVQLAQQNTTRLRADPLIEQVAAYIRANLRQNLSNNAVAEHFGYHPYYLNSLFLQCRGMTMHNYLAELRLALAKELLGGTSDRIGDIAVRCGFSGASYFTEFFVKRTGVTPSAYRERFL